MGFGRLLNHLPKDGPALTTIREWVAAFAYGAGYLLLGSLSRFLLTLAPQSELPGPAPPQLTRSRQAHFLSQAYHFWLMAEQL